MRLKELEREWRAKMQMRKGDVLLGSRRWMPLLERVVLELESLNPRGMHQLRRWRQSRFVLELKRRRGGATGKC